MLKYDNYAITFSEIPDEICLYITLTGCPIHCPECNSKWLWEDTGRELTFDELERLLEENKGITCIVFGGGDNDWDALERLCVDFLNCSKYVEQVNLAVYSGSKNINLNLCAYLDYYKIGPFDSKCGPLNNPNTNQRLYKIDNSDLMQPIMVDITDKFWK